MNLGRNLRLEQSLIELLVADNAPRAHYVGDDIDLYVLHLTVGFEHVDSVMLLEAGVGKNTCIKMQEMPE